LDKSWVRVRGEKLFKHVPFDWCDDVEKMRMRHERFIDGDIVECREGCVT
jgi:hypothetical protein